MCNAPARCIHSALSTNSSGYHREPRESPVFPTSLAIDGREFLPSVCDSS